ncbi:pyridoxamine 5'-phosphate oxidase family protein [Gemmobacter fulvus]|uniref:Pyridoxamine 5'-phosphate oxidase family protein n=1 Tax=Gemmobacter fulvus TaxID=2840474 RepID=A0A975S0B3_9RHOB|nr:pyridoxamine 5'-phosphate oxidase family protein [Gemmobacter fulvus]MBT9247549.1 pyridoxamine 5'-phosphate oxidase family protein [Gemmobacter fulvus]QWK89944.1 pyridoxamine 5'-phosphate oxidase family protein [Gemmobacter fulvus]
MPVSPEPPGPARDPVQPADAQARALAQGLLHAARHAALAVTDPETGTPGISRIAFGLDPQGLPLTLISRLAAHHAALSAHPVAAVMVGDPGDKGDPLTHPRLMIRVQAELLLRDHADHAALRAHWLVSHPKAQLYVDFPDFSFVRLRPLSALLNGGFGRAHRLAPDDLA